MRTLAEVALPRDVAQRGGQVRLAELAVAIVVCRLLLIQPALPQQMD